MKLDNKELQQIVGGKITAAYLNAIIRGVTFLVDIGRSLGTALRRIGSGKVCSL